MPQPSSADAPDAPPDAPPGGPRLARLLRRTDRLSRNAKVLVSMAADAGAVMLASLLVVGSVAPERVPGGLAPLVAGSLILLCFAVFGVYQHAIRAVSRRIFFDLARGGALATVLLVAGEAAVRGGFAPVLPVVMFGLLTVMFAGAARLLWADLHRRRGWRIARRPKVAIWGAGTAGMQLAAMLEADPGTELHAFIDSDPTKQAIAIRGRRVRGPDALPALAREGVERVILAIPSASPAERARVTRQVLAAGLRAQSVPRLESIMMGRNLAAFEDVAAEDILDRQVVAPMARLLGVHALGKSVLVTGAGGSIGSEIARQIARLGPSRLVLLDASEYALYVIETELRDAGLPGLAIEAVLGSVCDRALMDAVMTRHAVDVVYHAAAHKHVPIVEQNVVEGIRNNTLGTWRTALAAGSAGVSRFVLVSTDKAVRPTSLMGASKRLAERAIDTAQRLHPGTTYAAVRFGNVLESSGSVLPRFRAQIHRGGPLTVTHPEVTRYFMTIGEAAQLVIQAAALSEGGEVFALDMGEPVRIVDLARRLITLSGLTERTPDNPGGDVEIVFTGLRPGEKLFEELLIGDAPVETAHPRIRAAHDNAGRPLDFERLAVQLEAAVAARSSERLLALCAEHVEGYGRGAVLRGVPVAVKAAG